MRASSCRSEPKPDGGIYQAAANSPDTHTHTHKKRKKKYKKIKKIKTEKQQQDGVTL